jgi:hypothetical protein
MRANLTTLVAASRANPGRDVKASTWTANTIGGATDVYHYSTLMFTATGDRITPRSPGWGSTSDRCGVGRILRSIPGAWTFRPGGDPDVHDVAPVSTYRALYGETF